jgi:type II secretory pathway pseudopilin PulG
LSNAKLLFNPFERLRNVRQPTLGGVFSGRPDSNSMYPIERGVGRCSIATGSGCMPSTLPAYYELCSVPSLPTDNPVLSPGIPAFDAYAAEWSRQISSEGSANVIQEPPIRKMFTEFRNFYTEFAQHVPDITLKSGRHTFLHRARVAREQEDVIAFRAIRTELLEYWKKHLEDQERKKRSMEARIARFLQSDKYPSHVWEESSPAQSSESLPNRSPQSPIVLDSDVMARDGIPMTGNSVRRSCPQPHYRQMNQQPTHQYLYVEPKLSLDPAERYAFMKRRQLQQEALQQQAQQQQQIQQRRQQEQLQLDNIRQQAIVQTEQQNGHASIQSRRGSSSSRSSDNSGLAIDNEAEHFSMMREEEEPGPSTKRRRTNSWCHGESTDFASGQDTDGATLHHQMQAACGVKSFGSDADVTQTLFTGKGKGKVRE